MMKKANWVRTFLGALCVAVAAVAPVRGAEPEAGAMAALDVQALVDAAIARGEKVVTLPSGTYRPTSGGVNQHINLNKVHDLTIDGQGATLMFSSLTGYAFILSGCKNITLKNFTVDWNPLPFTQATITKKAPDSSWLEFEIHAGYPDFTASYAVKRVLIFDGKTRLNKSQVPTLYPREVVIQSPRTGRMTLPPQQRNLNLIEAGDMLVFTVRAGAGIAIRSSENTRVEDVQIWTAPGVAIPSRYVKGDNYFRYKVSRGPRPGGATEDRLISTCADGFNYAYARRGPTLENCDFSFMGDIQNVYKITLQKPTVLKAGDVIDIPNIMAQGFTIRNCYFHDSVANGLRILTSHGLIEGNRFERLKHCAMTIGPEYAFWREGGWAQDVTVRDNVIRDVLTDPDLMDEKAYSLGAISISMRPENPAGPFAPYTGKPVYAQDNRNIRVLNNTIDGCGLDGININAARDIRVLGNKLSRVNWADNRKAGVPYDLLSGYGITVNHSSNVTLANNTLTNRGAFNRGLAGHNPAAIAAPR